MYERSMCIDCGVKQQATKGQRNGKQIFKPRCGECDKKEYPNRKKKKRYSYRLHKKTYCEKCSFIAEHPCQLDVDHIDGNKKNGNPENLQTLCANCHRLKTHINRDNQK